MGPVAMLLSMNRTTLTAALKPLERQGLVRIDIGCKDRRGRLLILTDEGREMLAAAMPIWRDTHAAVEARLLTIDATELRAALAALA